MRKGPVVVNKKNDAGVRTKPSRKNRRGNDGPVTSLSVLKGNVTCHSKDGSFSAECNVGDRRACLREI